MELNLLFLPLLGGYLFYTRWNFTKYTARRCGRERLFFHAAAFGLCLLLVARIVVLGARTLPDNPFYLQLSAELWCAAALIVVGSGLMAGWPRLRRPRVAFNAWWRSVMLSLGGLALLWGSTVPIYAVMKGTLLTQAVSVALILSLMVVAIEFLARALVNMNGDVPLRTIRLRLSLLWLLAVGVGFLVANFGNTLDTYWHKFSPYQDSGTAFLACVIGLFAWWPLNLLYSGPAAIRRLHQSKQTSALDRLLYGAASDGALVQFAMDDGKFYVGYISDLPNDPDAFDAVIEFLPLVSGYRDESTKEVRFTTFYDHVYRGLPASDVAHFLRTIPRARVVSAGRFRQDLYLKFNARGQASSSADAED